MELRRPQLVKGPYLGDATALCFVKLPWDSPLPALLAGTGAQVDCYDLATGRQYFSSHVFDGVRVHGIHSVQSTCTASSFAIVAVHGERRVKLLKMSYESTQNQISLELWQTIPRFTKWVLDVRIFQDGDAVEAMKFIAIGLSDNTVWLWDFCLSQLVYHVDCSEKCLLYSMRLWGNSVETLRVAAGTIYNEVLVWKLERPELIQPTILHSSNGRRNSLPNDCPKQEAKPVQKFCGHEGSIYRISWSEDGRYLGSVSDDRSARIWKFDDPNSQAVAVLFGHAARVWDFHIDEKLLITASEDCTCGLWSWTGKLCDTLKGHVGRGIWRCIYDSQTAVLVTAGADASMKLYSLSEWAFKTNGCDDSRKEMELIHISLDKTEGNRDSKSEYFRCIGLVGPSSLYIATNRGLLHHVNLLGPGSLEWFSLLQTSRTSPIVCMDILVEGEMAILGDTDVYKEEFIACGDGQGYATVVKIAKNKSQLQLIGQRTWLAEADRQLLGIFWCKNLGSRLAFTMDPKGGLRCWSLQHAPEVLQDAPRLVAYFKSALCSRIVCLDACVKKQLLVCGDQRGNLVIFSLPVTMLDPDRAAPSVEVESSDAFRGAHGVSAVSSVSISGDANHQTEIVSTGRDGCVCKFVYESNASFLRPTSPGFSCTGVEKVTAITVVESVLNRAVRSGAKRRIAAGFSAADFVLWDSTNEVELKRIPCGGWRRPHSFLIGVSPESQFCFAYLKEQVICVCRSWADTSSETGLQLQSLQRQSHGREIHTVLLTPHLMPDMDWVLTGSEDGMVQITRYVGGLQEKLTVSSTLGEHVGGSAVRALAMSSNVYTLDGSSNEMAGNHETEPVLLFSAGAKEVLTCWLLEWAPKSLGNMNEDNNMSAKWLSTYTTFNKKTMQKDDLRYLAVTVFATQPAGGGTLIYFVVTAMSNATLTVKAFDLSNKIWCKVAVLEHHNPPVLALHHAVLPPLKQGLSSAKRFYVFSGSTDGSIAVWDLTHVVGRFVMKSGRLGAQDGIQLRPRSGRGSQGGKRRNRLNLEAVNGGLSDQRSEDSELKTVEDYQSNQLDSSIGVPFVECDETQNPILHPVFVLPRCHQSGVNCLCVSTTEGSTISVVTGGDDQALHFTALSLHDAVSAQSEAYEITVLSELIVSNAHSSALKGVWTDGKWVFSTGLDQRLRCWCHKSSSRSIELTESHSCVIDVPEAEALHARALHDGEGYRIAIVGRGLQIVNFSEYKH